MSAQSQSAAPPTSGRLALYRQLFAYIQTTRADLFRFWLAPFAGLPFRLGESLAEAKVPYAFDDGLDRLAGQATADFLSLLGRRFDPGRHDERMGTTRILREECMSARHTTPGSLEHETVSRASRVDPHLDCGLLDAWLSRGGPGALLVSGLEALFARALEEEVRSRGEAPYAFVVALAVQDLLEGKKDLAKTVNLRAVGYERLEKAVGLCLFGAVEVAARSALTSFRRRNLGVDLRRTWLLVQTALNPLAFVSIKSRALQNDVNPWGLSPSAVPALEDVYEDILQRDPQPATLERSFGQAVAAAPAATNAAATIGLRIEARARLYDLLAQFDDGRTDWLRLLASVVRRDADLDAFLFNPRSRDAIRRHLSDLERKGKPDEVGRHRIADVAGLLAAFDRDDPTVRPVEGMPSPQALAASGVTAYLAHTLDRFCDGRLDEARGHLRHARTDGAAADLLETWSAGRLYRFSADGRPFLRPLRRRQQAQLFIDLKGFTRRTHRAKEVVMADFMRQHFYLPILEAAKRRFGGIAWGGDDEAPVELHNLLGDAAAFAGAPGDLVALAQDMQRIGRRYAESLRAAAPSLADSATADALGRALEEETRTTERRLEALGREVATLREEIGRKAALPDAEKARLLGQLLEARFAELKARRAELEARLAEGGADAQEAAVAQLKRLEAWETELRTRQKRTRTTLEGLSPADRGRALTELLTRPEQRRLAQMQRESTRLQNELAVSRRTLEDHRRDVSGFGLETGIYISHGASAEVIAFDDELFGPLRVAISEKINEAARGTARNAEIKAKMDAHLDRARRERGRPGLSWPFLVYVDSAYSLVLPPALSARVERAVRERDAVLAEEAALDLSRWTLRDLSRSMGTGDGKPPEMVQVLNDIHNLGVALSEEALDALLRETLASRFHFVHAGPVSELHRDLQEPFVYLEDDLSLVISVKADAGEDPARDALVFRHAGDVQFRGFERGGATGVYELLSPDTRFHRLLVAHHLPAWIEEAREDPGRLVTGL